MSVMYASTGEVELAEVCLDVGAAHQRLSAVIPEIPANRAGKEWDGAAVIDEVACFLKALHEDLRTWGKCKAPEVRIVPGLFNALRERIQNQLDITGVKIRFDPDADQLLNALASSCLADALHAPLDLEAIHKRHGALIGEYARSESMELERSAGRNELVDCPAKFKPCIDIIDEARKLYPDLLDWLIIKGGLNSKTRSLAKMTPEILAAAIVKAADGRPMPGPLAQFVAMCEEVVTGGRSFQVAQSNRTAKAKRPTAPRKVSARRNGRKRTAART